MRDGGDTQPASPVVVDVAPSAETQEIATDTPEEKNSVDSTPQPASEAKPVWHKKLGRQRTNELVKELIAYRIVRNRWPGGLSSDMQIYYNQHYIRKSGKFHEKAVQWRVEASEKFGRKFRLTEKIYAS